MLLLLGGLIALSGCDRRVAPYVAPQDEPASPERAVRIPGLDTPTPRSREPLRGLRDVQTPPDSLRGTIRLAPGLAGPGEGTLFLIARGPGQGPPLAVKRLPVRRFPLPFEIGSADVMIPGRAFRGPIQLSARIDRDGNPMTRGPDDLTAAIATPLEPGASGIELVLSAD